MAATPLSPASPEEAPPLPGLQQSDAKAGGVVGLGGGEGFGPGIPDVMRQRDEPAPPHPWEKPKENQLGDAESEVRQANNYLTCSEMVCFSVCHGYLPFLIDSQSC